MELHQVVVAAAPGDAVTGAAFELRTLLRTSGPSDIYARHIDPRLAGDVLPLESLAGRAGSRPDEDVLVYHASIGEPTVHSFLMQRPERIVLVYHNISPASAFRPYDPAFADLLDGGRRELHEMRDRVVGALAVSAFNARELEEIGYRDVRVAPLIVDPQPLHDVEPDPDLSRLLRDHVDGPVLLFVGQLLPHKRPDLLIEAFHLLATAIMPDARLVIVGAPRLARYAQLVEQLVKELNLPRCWLAGAVSFAQLAAFYRRADAFVTASEHEGFCAPLVEAMSFGLPVVARDFAAIPDTLGQAGLLLPAASGPALLAEAMAATISDPEVREAVTASGPDEVRRHAPEQARVTSLDQLLDLV
ncbi:MAG: hypothetical protein QOG64_1987 [Acidimicrobiaceae bacterium]|nr:hypothetical protein [Acidimicrobiaceae bacterium]